MTECGIKNSVGEPCVLSEGHGSAAGWKWRQHETAGGDPFTFMGERQKARPVRGVLYR